MQISLISIIYDIVRFFIMIESQGHLKEFSNNSLLDTYSRIIQKNQIRLIDVDQINANSKRANIIALEQYIEEIKKEYIENFEDTYVIERWFSPVEGLNQLLLAFALRSFKFYLAKSEEENRFILAYSVDGEEIFIELDNRYCKSYQEKIKRRANFLSWKYQNSKSVLLTLTIDPKLYHNDKYRMWNDIKKQYNRFITAVKYYFKKRGIKFPPYVCTIEAQKNGNPHLHICFLGASRIMDYRKLRDLWKLGYIWINRDSSGKRIRSPINYLMKYITKTYTDTNEYNQLTQALCWLFNIRSYQCSRGLITPLKPKSDSGYSSEYLVIVDDSIPISFLYKNIDFVKRLNDPFFRIKYTAYDPNEYRKRRERFYLRHT